MTSGPGEAVLRVLVVDDHPVFRDGLATVLTDRSFEVDTATDGESALAAVANQPGGFDVVLMDLGLPGMSGVEATRRLLACDPAVRICVLTMSDDAAAVTAAVGAGAGGYLLKESSGDDIARAVRGVAAGDAVFGGRISERVLAAVSGRGERSHPFPQLTEREREVLELVAAGLDNATIARRLALSDKTVRNQVSLILTKLQLPSRAAAIARARDVGVGLPAPSA